MALRAIFDRFKGILRMPRKLGCLKPSLALLKAQFSRLAGHTIYLLDYIVWTDTSNIFVYSSNVVRFWGCLS